MQQSQLQEPTGTLWQCGVLDVRADDVLWMGRWDAHSETMTRSILLQPTHPAPFTCCCLYDERKEMRAKPKRSNRK